MATKKLSLPGKAVTPVPEPPAVENLVNVSVVQQQEVIGVVRGEPLTRTMAEVQDDDVVELQFDGGIVQYIRVDDLEKESPKRRDAGGGADVIEVPAQFQRGGGPSRGSFDWVLKGLKIIRIDPAKELANLGERAIVKRFEDQTMPGPALYRVSEAGYLVDPVQSPNDVQATGPWLLFLHGTASSTNGSFGGLFEKRLEGNAAGEPAGPTVEWTKLWKFYEGRVLALQHRTFSESPVDNALYAAERLPRGARLHLVSHSRGGLVGELLALRDFKPKSLEVFEAKRLKQAKTEDDRAEARQSAARLRQLGELLNEKQFVIEKFVRVAAPARGTVLASERLDRYFTIILNLIGAIPILRNDPIYAVLKATGLELIRRRTDPKRLPGLEAMMPESALIHFLNQGAAMRTSADLAVIAGDLQGDTFWTRLKAFATDVFYLEEHDLVVNTAAMFGGMGRLTAAHGFYHRGGIVNHFNYFHNERTRGRLHAWLTSKDPDPEFQVFDPEKKGIQIQPVMARGGEAVKPWLIIVPDVFGNRLHDEPLWPSGVEIVEGEAPPPPPLLPVYGPLNDRFAPTYEVRAHPWDFRQSLIVAANELAERIVGAPEGRTVSLIGHGAGGLIVHLVQKNRPDAWERVQRALLLGVPHHGMFAAVDWCSGRARLVEMMALSEGLKTAAEIGATLRMWESIVELAPDEFLRGDDRDSNWTRAGADASPDTALLDNAAALRAQLLDGDPPDRVAGISGQAPETVIGFDANTRMVTITASGDGRVAHSQLHPRIGSWSVDVWHGDLPAQQDAFNAYSDLLTAGNTSLLPLTSQTAASPEERPETEEKPLFPTADEINAEALGSRKAAVQQDEYPIVVSVTHGDLRMANYPVAVGHYFGDSINGAEEVLDCQLARRLTRRFQLGLYPGPAGTVEIVRMPQASPPGALVIGLGQVGSATAETVRRGVMNAALRYAIAIAEEREPEEGEKWRSAAFSAVSIATRGGATLGPETSIGAIIRGALDANRMLRTYKLWDRVRIDQIEFVELYEQRAIAAVYAARNAAKRIRLEAESGERIEVRPLLRYTASGRFRTPPDDTASGWWQRLFVTVGEEDQQPAPADFDEDDMALAEEQAKDAVRRRADRPMRYVVLGDRARVEAELQCRERNATKHLIKNAIGTPAFNPELSGALFELLIPNAIKTASAEAPNVVMILDHDTAQYPWEVVSDPLNSDGRPYAVRTGMLRQFIAPQYRPAPNYAGLKTALVVGDTFIDPNPDNLPELTGAQEEAKGAARVLGAAGYETRLHIRATASEVETALFAKPYRILHLAGHGIYRRDRPQESGMVLGNNVYLTPCMLGQLRTVPDLVFLNCCFLGGIDAPSPSGGRANYLAASVAEELINMGVKAIVAAGWAVDDGAAVTFASTFYQDMVVNGRPFGEAVRNARQAVWRNHSNTNTWAAYQCYGNPGFRLVEVEDGGGGSRVRDFCSKREYIDDLRTMSARATDVSLREELHKELSELVAKLPGEWRDGEMLTLIGNAWRDLGDYANAVEALEKAYEDMSATMPVKGIEQLTNMLTRLAVQRHNERKEEERDKWIELAQQRIALLDLLPKTFERLSLMGSNAKKLAAISPDRDKRRELLQRAADKYGEAAEIAQKVTGNPDPYPLLNSALMYWLADPGDPRPREMADSALKMARSWEKDADYWRRASLPDYQLMDGLMKGQIDVAAVAKGYRTAMEKAVTKGQQQSVIEHIDFIIDMLEGEERKPLVEQLKALAEALRND